MGIRLNNITTIRTFDESPAKWFMWNDEKISRAALEYKPYKLLKKIIRKGEIKAIQKV